MIDLEFQATLNAISLPKIDEKTTVNEALSKFSEKVDRQQGLPAGTAKSAIKEAIPYSPVFGNRTSGQFVPEPAQGNTQLQDMFSNSETGLFIVSLDNNVLKVLTPNDLKGKKKRKKKKKTEKKDSDDESDVAVLSEEINTSPSQPANLDFAKTQHMVIEMQKVIEEERKQRIKSEENTERKVNKLKKEIAENRNRYKKDMVENTDRYKKDMVENTDRHKTEMKELENKVAELENKVAEQKTEIKDERKKRMVLEGDVNELKHSLNVYADWIVSGCQPIKGGEPLRQIQIRNLLDRVQAKLAWFIGLTDAPYTRYGSYCWREEVKGSTLAERLISARQLLQKASRNPLNASLSVRNQISVFMSSKEALQLAVKQKSQFCLRGDGVAHHDLNKPQFISIVDEHCKWGGKYGNGLKALIQFLFP